MTFRGEYRDGVVVPSGPVSLSEGTVIDFRPAAPSRKPSRKRSKKRKPLSRAVSPRPQARPKPKAKTKLKNRTLYELFKPIIGKGVGLPADYSYNHDHYLYGTPKRKP